MFLVRRWTLICRCFYTYSVPIPPFTVQPSCWLWQEKRPTVICFFGLLPFNAARKKIEKVNKRFPLCILFGIGQKITFLRRLVNSLQWRRSWNIYILMSWTTVSSDVRSSFQSVEMNVFIFQPFHSFFVSTLRRVLFFKKFIHISLNLIYNDSAHYWLFRWYYDDDVHVGRIWAHIRHQFAFLSPPSLPSNGK